MSCIAEAPKNAASALLEASLGEEKYFIYLFVTAAKAASSKEGVPLTIHSINLKFPAYTILIKKFTFFTK